MLPRTWSSTEQGSVSISEIALVAREKAIFIDRKYLPGFAANSLAEAYGEHAINHLIGDIV
jgi:hypothetical protein